MTVHTVYADKSWNPLFRNVELTEGYLQIGYSTMPMAELHLAAMAEAYQRGWWLGGGGSERYLSQLPEGPGVVPVVRITGSSQPVRVRRAAFFARCLGELAVRENGGPGAVAALAAQAEREGVPLWIPRRIAPGPMGPITVVVERRLARADVWGPGAPAVRLRGPHGMEAGDARVLAVTVGDAPAVLSVNEALRKSKRSVMLQASQGSWELRWHHTHSSRLYRDGRPVALLTRPLPYAGPHPRPVLLPLADVWLDGGDPLDAVMAHFFAVCFGLGDGTGRVRFGSRHRLADPGHPSVWEDSWYTGLGSGGDDSGPGGGGDGWGGSGGDGGGGGFGGGDGGGGGFGGGDGGGGGGGGGGDGGGGGGGGGG
jgi:hypothetical protein